MECISKGKAHKRYEFGGKVGLATCSCDNWFLGIQAFHRNPYNGHTLKNPLEQIKKLTGWGAQEDHADMGYQGHGIIDVKINLLNFRKMFKKMYSVKMWFKRRSAIEPLIGHLKHDCRMQRNYLQGPTGDEINALLNGCGFNMKKLLKVILYPKWLRTILHKMRFEFRCIGYQAI